MKTIQIYRTGWKQALPILNLNNLDETLELHFDIMSPYPRDLKYKVEHYSANWQKSNLSFYDFADGLPEDYITDVTTSNAMGPRYTHYGLKIPNENFTLKFSGNYVIKVYDSQTDSTILEIGFLVVEPKVNIDVSPKRATNAELRFAGQEIDFSISSNNYLLTNPYEDLKVFVLQNFRYDNAIALEPLFVKHDEIDYNFEVENVFFGGNEFRPLDLRNLNANPTVNLISRENKIQEFATPRIEKRAFLNYKTEFDINGRYVDLNNNDFFDPKTHNEYVWVDFQLNTTYLYDKRKVYVFGELSNYQFKDEFALSLNQEKGIMSKKILLKAGYYNYLFLVNKPNMLPNPRSTSTWDIEGNHEETENEYQILIYHKAPGTYHDALVGFGFVKYPVGN